MTREEIQAQINLATMLNDQRMYSDVHYAALIVDLEDNLDKAKSIQDLQREAFEAGRNSGYEECLEEEDRTYPHTFEDYLKSLENGATEKI